MGNLDITPSVGPINADALLPGGTGVWIDFNFGVNSLARGSSAPDIINLSGTNIETLGFDGVNTTEEVSVVLELNHNWKEGTVLKPHIHWYAVNGNLGNVNWQMDYVLLAFGATVPAATTINTIVATPGIAWQATLTSLPDIDASGFLLGTQMHIRLFRDPTDNDTYGADAALATFGLHVQVDTLGSRQVVVK
jgi:hypothetical protein